MRIKPQIIGEFWKGRSNSRFIMYLSKLVVLIFVVLNSYYVRSESSDIVYLRDHFITNLLEENRDKFSMQLTDDIEKSIDLKINAFLNEIDGPKERRRRDIANDLLFNEKRKLKYIQYKNLLLMTRNV